MIKKVAIIPAKTGLACAAERAELHPEHLQPTSRRYFRKGNRSKKKNDPRTFRNRRIVLRGVQCKIQRTIRLHISSPPHCIPSSLIADDQVILSLGERCTWIFLLPIIYVPYNLRRSTWNDTIRRSNRVCIPVFADGRDRQMGWRCENIRVGPAEGDELVGCNFVEGCNGLRGVCNDKSACCSSLGNSGRGWRY